MGLGKPAPIIIKKKVIHGGHHGGAWKVAYADFVTAMMALFIVLWLLSTSQKVKEAVGGYFKDPESNGKQVGTNMTGTGPKVAAPEKEDMSDLKKRLETVIKLLPQFESLKANIELTITQEGLRIELLENAHGLFFDSGSSRPSDAGKQILQALAKELSKIPNQILVEGHTDAAPYSGDIIYSNWELSSDRANQARRLMMASGLGINRISQVRGFADQDLRNRNNPRDPSNRRVSLIVRYLGEPEKLKLTASGIPQLGRSAASSEAGASHDKAKPLPPSSVNH